jgi:hypothetical protein
LIGNAESIPGRCFLHRKQEAAIASLLNPFHSRDPASVSDTPRQRNNWQLQQCPLSYLTVPCVVIRIARPIRSPEGTTCDSHGCQSVVVSTATCFQSQRDDRRFHRTIPSVNTFSRRSSNLDFAKIARFVTRENSR